MLVMAEFTETYDVNKDVFTELLSVFYCKLNAFTDKVRSVSIDVEYWGTNDFCNLGAMNSRPALVRGCCKPNLVIYDNVHNTSNRIVEQIMHLYALVNNSLPSNRSITMNHHRKYFFFSFIIF